MELESPDGSKIPITTDPPTVLGRSLTAADPTVSRRHLSLRLLNPTTPTASFQVTGKNPVLVCTADGRNNVYRASEKGELAPGDRVSLSIKNPRFFTVNTKQGEDAPVDRTVLDAVERRERRTRERLKEQEVEVEVDTGVSDIELDIDVSEIDPVKEFGFLVTGREFDSYPERKIRHATKWNWFLEEKKGEVDDDDEDDDGEDVGKASSSKGRGRRKRRGGDDDDDDEVWTGESEDEKELAVRAGRNKRAKYSTRSKDLKKPRKDALDDRKAVSQKIGEDELEDEDEDEDETLGGFIIDDDEEGVMDEEELEDEEEEEELEDEEELDED